MALPDKQATIGHGFKFHPHHCRWEACWTPISWSRRDVDTRLGTNGDSHAKALQSKYFCCGRCKARLGRSLNQLH